ncbi:MAG: polysaccharide export protein [Acidobacteria bacterium]|nr:polysaccharide export protein [Acidobacteriota bacterium]
MLAQEAPPVLAGETVSRPWDAKTGTAGGAWSPALTGERHPLYRIARSDVVELNFSFTPEFHQVLTVQPDGYLALKDLPALYAAGMTVPQLQEALVEAYAGILRDPEITVILKDFERPYFTVSGEVARPGKYELRGEMTVTEALAVAGGWNGQAKHSQVVLFRRVSPLMAEAKLLNLKRMFQTRDLGEDVAVHSGDMLFVPRNALSKIRQFLPTSSLGLYGNATRF